MKGHEAARTSKGSADDFVKEQDTTGSFGTGSWYPSCRRTMTIIIIS